MFRGRGRLGILWKSPPEQGGFESEQGTNYVIISSLIKNDRGTSSKEEQNKQAENYRTGDGISILDRVPMRQVYFLCSRSSCLRFAVCRVLSPSQSK